MGGKEGSGLSVGEGALLAFLFAAFTAAVSFVLLLLESYGWIRLPPLVWYELGSAVGYLLGLAVLLAAAALVIKVARRLVGWWKTRGEKARRIPVA
jgi:hypothetical protein